MSSLDSKVFKMIKFMADSGVKSWWGRFTMLIRTRGIYRIGLRGRELGELGWGEFELRVGGELG